jgi:Mor family transcriptional regulator
MILADLIGRESLEKLAQKYGGTRLYVPIGRRRSDRLDQLNLLIGSEATEKLQQFYGGQTVDVPNLKSPRIRDSPLVRRDRNRAIRQSLMLYSCRQTALKFGLTERQVFNILRFIRQSQKNAA